MINSITVSGTVGRDCEQRQTSSGKLVADFSVAVNMGKKPDGSWKESIWIKCVAWDKTAEFVKEIRKKDRVVVSGRLDQESYTAQDGTQRTNLVIQLTGFEVTSKGGDTEHSTPPSAPRYGVDFKAAGERLGPAPTNPQPAAAPNDDDWYKNNVPF